MHIRLFCFLSFFVFSVFFLSAPQVKAEGWLDLFFPMQPKGPQPAETLRAPFADNDIVIEELDAQGNPQDVTPLHLRHRTNTVITRWVQQAVPIMLSYQADGYKDQYRAKVLNFSKTGAGEYLKFLKDNNFLKTLDTGRFDISGFIQDYPVILNEGAVDGRYRWVYKANIMVTYLRRGVKDYADVRDGDSLSRTYVVTFQVGRHKDAGNEHGLLIETWSVKAKK